MEEYKNVKRNTFIIYNTIHIIIVTTTIIERQEQEVIS